VNLTEWIPCATPPIREGWYDVEIIYQNGADEKNRRYYWKLGDFRLSDRDMLRAPIIYEQDRWRGLTEQAGK
jgi:hypothetical protein